MRAVEVPNHEDEFTYEVVNDALVVGTDAWVTRYILDDNGQVVRKLTPAVVGSYTPGDEETSPSYTAGSTGVVYAYEYDELGQLIKTGVKQGYDTTTDPTEDSLGGYTRLGMIEYGDPQQTDEREYLPKRIRRYKSHNAWSASEPTDDETEVLEFDYAFHSTSATAGFFDALAWIQTRVEAEETDEGGPGGWISSQRYFDASTGFNTWSRLADDSLMHREFDSLSGNVTSLVANAGGSGAPTPDTGFLEASASMNGRQSEGGSITTSLELDPLGRVSAATVAGGQTSMVRRSIRPMFDRPGMYFFCEEIYPASAEIDSEIVFESPATFNWYNAAGKSIASIEYLPSAQDPVTSPDDISLDEEAARWCARHSLTGQRLETRRWPDVSNLSDVYIDRFRYDLIGRLEYEIDPEGGVVAYSYDSLDRLVSVAEGSWDEQTQLPTSAVTINDYEYDDGGVGNSNVTSVIAHTGDAADPDGGDRETLFDYDWRDRLERIVNPLPPHAFMVYDNQDRPLEAGLFDDVPTAINSTGRVMHAAASYSQRGAMWRRDLAINPTEGVGGASGSLHADSWFDPVGRLIGHVNPSVSAGGAGMPAVKVDRDGLGRVRTAWLTDGGGFDSYADVYDDSTWSTIVDDDVVLEERILSYVASGAQIGLPELVATWRRSHDTSESSRGSLTALNIDDAIVSYEGRWYDELGRLIRTGDFGTNESGYQHTSGHTAPTVSQSSPPEGGESGTYASTGVRVTSIAYDGRGRVVDVADALNRHTHMFFDDLDRRIAVVENFVNATDPTWDESAERWTLTNLGGGTLSDEDRATSFVFDSLDRITKRVAYAPGTLGGNLFQETAYDYGTTRPSSPDADQSLISSTRLLRRIRYPQTSGSGAGSAAGDTESNFHQTFAYNALGEVRSATDQNGTTHRYSRDGVGRVTLDYVAAFGSGIDTNINAIAATYLDNGRTETITSFSSHDGDPEGTGGSGASVANQVLLTYNDLLQPLRVYQEHSGAVDADGSGDDSPWVEYAYTTSSTTNRSRLESMMYPGGSVVGYRYGSSNTLNDHLSRVEALVDGHVGDVGTTSVALYEWLGVDIPSLVDYVSPDIQLDRSLAHNGTRTRGRYPGFDRYGRIARHTWADGAIAQSSNDSTLPTVPPLVELGFDYDLVDNLKSRTDLRPGASIINRDLAYTHDGLNRVREAKRGQVVSGTFTVTAVASGTMAGSRKWDLDQFGNWAGVFTDLNGNTVSGAVDYSDAGEEVSGVFNRANEITQLTKSENTTVDLPFAYDDAGNLTEQHVGGPGDPNTGTGNDDALIFVHDAWNRLVSVSHRTSDSATPTLRARYAYNALHWRIRKDVDTSVTGISSAGEATTGTGDDFLDEQRHFYYDLQWRLLEERVNSNFASGSQTGVSPVDQSGALIEHLWGVRYVDDLVRTRTNSNWSTEGTPGGEDPPTPGDFTDTADSRLYALTDQQFSVIALVSNTGRLIERVEYSPYGEARHRPRHDITGDGAVSADDRTKALAANNKRIYQSGYDPDADVNRDGIINSNDTIEFGTSSYCSALMPGLVSAMSTTAGSVNGQTYNTIGYCGYVFNAEIWAGIALATGPSSAGCGGLYTVRYRHYDPSNGRWLERDMLGYVDGSSLYEYVGGMALGMVDPMGLQSAGEWFMQVLSDAGETISDAWDVLTGNAESDLAKWQDASDSAEQNLREHAKRQYREGKISCAELRRRLGYIDETTQQRHQMMADLANARIQGWIDIIDTATMVFTGPIGRAIRFVVTVIDIAYNLSQGNVVGAAVSLNPFGGGGGAKGLGNAIDPTIRRNIDDLIDAARKKYPKKAGKIEEHHIDPKYLGGAKDGPTMPLDGAYHQEITNEFRNEWPYGTGQHPSKEQFEEIKERVYGKWPLP